MRENAPGASPLTGLTPSGLAQAALGGPGGQAFLDTTDIDVEEHFPRHLVEALFDARVVVLFVDEAYFQSWYCRWELRAALAPLLALAPGASKEEKQSALAHLVVALPPAGRSTFDLNHRAVALGPDSRPR
ncbi:TIR domain-containing protein [Archangium sp.]|uniref:TIR domain-containing protein n=1 Tax=Archangium sp. TaxID=1872627 RepID=UPI00389ACB1D